MKQSLLLLLLLLNTALAATGDAAVERVNATPDSIAARLRPRSKRKQLLFSHSGYASTALDGSQVGANSQEVAVKPSHIADSSFGSLWIYKEEIEFVAAEEFCAAKGMALATATEEHEVAAVCSSHEEFPSGCWLQLCAYARDGKVRLQTGCDNQLRSVVCVRHRVRRAGDRPHKQHFRPSLHEPHVHTRTHTGLSESAPTSEPVVSGDDQWLDTMIDGHKSATSQASQDTISDPAAAISAPAPAGVRRRVMQEEEESSSYTVPDESYMAPYYFPPSPFGPPPPSIPPPDPSPPESPYAPYLPPDSPDAPWPPWSPFPPITPPSPPPPANPVVGELMAKPSPPAQPNVPVIPPPSPPYYNVALITGSTKAGAPSWVPAISVIAALAMVGILVGVGFAAMRRYQRAYNPSESHQLLPSDIMLVPPPADRFGAPVQSARAQPYVSLQIEGPPVQSVRTVRSQRMYF